MNTITDIKEIPNFNQQKYDALIQQAKAKSVDIGFMTSSLLEAVNKGNTFDEAVKLVKSDLPKLALPNAMFMANLAQWPALPAPGAIIMALITEIATEQRQQNRETIAEQSRAVVDSMKDQADKMRVMAVTQLVLGLASAAITVVGGLAQGAIASGGDSSMATLQSTRAQGVGTAVGAGSSALGGDSSMATLQSTRAQGVGTAAGAGSSALGAVSQFAGTMFQAKFKEMEADQEKMRGTRDSLKELNDGLKELIQKTLSSAESIQQGKNQATTRILA